MKIRFLSLVFLVILIARISYGQDVHVVTVVLDSKKPVYLRIKTKGLGPNYQCYYGRMLNESVFPVLLPTASSGGKAESEFSDVYRFDLVDVEKANGFEFTSQVECWLQEEDPMLSDHAREFRVEILQQKDGQVLFSDEFNRFSRWSLSDLWVSNPKSLITRVRLKIKH